MLLKKLILVLFLYLLLQKLCRQIGKKLVVYVLKDISLIYCVILVRLNNIEHVWVEMHQWQYTNAHYAR